MIEVIGVASGNQGHRSVDTRIDICEINIYGLADETRPVTEGDDFNDSCSLAVRGLGALCQIRGYRTEAARSALDELYRKRIAAEDKKLLRVQLTTARHCAERERLNYSSVLGIVDWAAHGDYDNKIGRQLNLSFRGSGVTLLYAGIMEGIKQAGLRVKKNERDNFYAANVRHVAVTPEKYTAYDRSHLAPYYEHNVI